jgi:lipopolysaccharide export system protein LptA
MSKISTLYKLQVFLLVCAALFCNAAIAEDADRNKPIHIESDRLSVDETNQISTFDGHVQFIQGTILIQADRIVVTQDQNGYKHCTATGKVAHFHQKREGLNEFVEGYGERIEYDTLADTIDFFEQARVKRGQDDLRGNRITYSTRTELLQVNGTPGANPDLPNQGRVHAVIQPKNEAQPQRSQPKPDSLSIKPSTTLIQPPPP